MCIVFRRPSRFEVRAEIFVLLQRLRRIVYFAWVRDNDEVPLDVQYLLHDGEQVILEVDSIYDPRLPPAPFI